jgi:hypothetical protein
VVVASAALLTSTKQFKILVEKHMSGDDAKRQVKEKFAYTPSS